MMGLSAGFTLRYVGLFGRFAGKLPRAALIAAKTSRAAASILRFRSNCSVMPVDPSELVEDISVTAAMCENWRSSGVAIDDAVISGLAPGSPAFTEMVGKSTCGSGDTGNKRYATAPAKMIATTSSVVAVGRRMNGSDTFIAYCAGNNFGGSPPGGNWGCSGPESFLRRPKRIARRSNHK